MESNHLSNVRSVGSESHQRGHRDESSSDYWLLMLLGYAYPKGVANHPINTFALKPQNVRRIHILENTLELVVSWITPTQWTIRESNSSGYLRAREIRVPKPMAHWRAN